MMRVTATRKERIEQKVERERERERERKWRTCFDVVDV